MRLERALDDQAIESCTSFFTKLISFLPKDFQKYADRARNFVVQYVTHKDVLEL